MCPLGYQYKTTHCGDKKICFGLSYTAKLTHFLLMGTWPLRVVSFEWKYPYLTEHDDVIKWNHFPRNWPFVRGIIGPVNSPHKGQWRGALMFSLICVWINDWVNNGEAGDMRRYRIHYDVTVMAVLCFNFCCDKTPYFYQCSVLLSFATWAWHSWREM